MPFATNVANAFVRVGTEFKSIKTLITGSNSSDLSVLATTAKSSIVAAINELAGRPQPQPATETVQGLVELATTGEAAAGTDTVRAVTPAGAKAYFDGRVSTAQGLGASDTLVPSQAAVKAYADGLLDANNAYVYKGALDASANPNYPAASAGHTYKVSVAGRIGGGSGPRVEVGDSLTCLVDGSPTGNHATVGANWLITQTNIDGAVVGPETSVGNNFASYDGTTGKVLKDSGVGPGSYYTKTEIGDPETNFVTVFQNALL